MNILITGGTGFIGTELRGQLLQQGHYLTIVSRSPEDYKDEHAKNQQFISWDDTHSLQMNDQDAVINLAGSPIFGQRWTDSVKKSIYKSRIESTEQLVAAITNCDNPPEIMVSASGISYYGDRDAEILDESEPPGSAFLSRVCVAWEAASHPVMEAGVRLANPRIGIVLEKGGGALEQMLTPFKLFVGGAVGSGQQYFPWVHMQDLIRAILFPLEHTEFEGAYNITSPEPVKMQVFAEKLGEVLNRPSFFRVPESVLRLALGEAADPIAESIRAKPAKLEKGGFKFRYTDLSEALADILG